MAKKADAATRDLKAQRRANMARRVDGWANVFNGMGTAKDASVFTRMMPEASLTHYDLEALYRTDGLSRRIVDIIPDMLLRDPWMIKGDLANEIYRYLEARQATTMVKKAMKWARLYGGSIMVMQVVDGRGLERPLDEKKVKTIEKFKVYDRHSILDNEADFDNDIDSPTYGERLFYTVQPRQYRNRRTFRVHASRVFVFDGRDVPDMIRQQNQGWGDSELQAVIAEVRRWAEALQNSAYLLRDFVQATLAVKGLTELLETPEGEALVRDRLEVLDMSRSILNTMLIDEGETYEKKISSVAGVGDLLDRLASSLSAVLAIPQMILFGRSPGALSATGEGEIRSFYDTCKADQRTVLAPILVKLARMAGMAADGPKLGEKILGAHIDVAFTPFWQPTLKEITEARKAIAETDQIYMDMGVLHPDEIAISRFKGDYSYDTRLMYERKEPTAPLPDDDPRINPSAGKEGSPSETS